MTYHVQTQRKSLAQVLYEASPSYGWTGSWERLDREQAAWWEAYADLARRYLGEELDNPESRSIDRREVEQ